MGVAAEDVATAKKNVKQRVTEITGALFHHEEQT